MNRRCGDGVPLENRRKADDSYRTLSVGRCLYFTPTRDWRPLSGLERRMYGADANWRSDRRRLGVCFGRADNLRLRHITNAARDYHDGHFHRLRRILHPRK